MKTSYDALLLSKTQVETPTATVDLGDLLLPTGRLYCCDPFLSPESGPLSAQLKPGSYPVRLILADMAEWGWRVALAGLLLSTQEVAEWVSASYIANGRDHFRYRVDAGLACFMDAQTEQLFRAKMEEFYENDPNANYYDDVLKREFAQSAVPGRSSRDGDWNLHYPVENRSANVAMFATGLGDGEYPCSVGLDVEGEVSMVVTDFGLLQFDS